MIDVRLEFAPQPVKAQEPTNIRLTPSRFEGGKEPVALEKVHTKDVHLVIVSEDLSFFSHVHPEQVGNAYAVNFLFPFGGRFLLYSDIKPVNGSPAVIRKTVEVQGTRKDPPPYQQEVLTSNLEGISVHLEESAPGAFKVHISQDGASVPISSLGEYLGAKAHVVMIPLESKEYLHVHPMVEQETLVLHTSFAAEGIYRAWVQLLLAGNLYTFDFVLSVTELPKQGTHPHH